MNAYNDLLWAVFGWTTAGREIMANQNVIKKKVNTNVFIYYYPPQSAAGFYPAQVCYCVAELLQKQGG